MTEPSERSVDEHSAVDPRRSGLEEALNKAAPLYLLPQDDALGEALIPAFMTADSVDCMMGFFSSSSLAQLAPGLAEYLSRSEAPLRLIISPYLGSEDKEAMRRATNKELVEMGSELLVKGLPDADALSTHTLDCLVWLLRRERLQIRIALMREALFHPKVWIFRQCSYTAVLHGSSNMTNMGLARNREQLTVSRNWKGEEAAYHVAAFEGEFNSLWSGSDATCLVFDLPTAVRTRLLRDYGKGPAPSPSDFRRLWRRAQKLSETNPHELPISRSALGIPSSINYRRGEYAHQGEAVDAWVRAGNRGILEMATGSGKTITAMICASLLQEGHDKLLVVVSAPYRPLITQWCSEIPSFGVRPINLAGAGGPAGRDRAIKEACRRLHLGISAAEVLVVSNATLCTPEFISSIERAKIPSLLIADECHNLGAATFVKNPPTIFSYRLGLSATPIRQYDEHGTEELIRFFGCICYQFTLEDAIGKCLTPYDYYVHSVHLNSQEMDEWRELSAEIGSLAWKLEQGQSDPTLDSLLRKRRLVLETAEEKIHCLSGLLDNEDTSKMRYALIYATDKDPGQLEKVNQLLNDRHVLFHQVTNEETAKNQVASAILEQFQSGELQFLTAKRVLDEGVNIPQIKTAYLLASTTVRRQWIQRRGRLLRTCRAIEKTHATIHDFVVLPPNFKRTDVSLDSDARKIVRSECERVWEFARLSRNGADRGGAYRMIQSLQASLLR